MNYLLNELVVDVREDFDQIINNTISSFYLELLRLLNLCGNVRVKGSAKFENLTCSAEHFEVVPELKALVSVPDLTVFVN